MQKLSLLNLILISLLFIGCNKPLSISEIENPAGDNTSLSRLYTDNTGTVFMSWLNQSDTDAQLLFSRFEGDEWSEPEMIASSSDWFVNWADFPSIISHNGVPLAAHWLSKIPGNRYSYNVEVAGYTDGDFSSPIIPHKDGTASEHGFVSMIPMSDSSFYAIWLDGRNTGGHGHNETDPDPLSSAMTLRGALINSSGLILSEDEIDPSVCDCCNTSMARTSSGLIAVYRNRTSEEIRDTYFVKQVNGVWSDPKPVASDNWKIAACPVNGPAVDALGEDIAVAWFTKQGENSAVKISFSSDEGGNFSDPIVLDAENPIGRIDLEMTSKRAAWVSWIKRTGDEAELQLQLVNETGMVLETHSIPGINPSRATGFPQISDTKNGELIISWTQLTEESRSIKTAIIR